MAHEPRRGSALTSTTSSIFRSRGEVLLETVLIVQAFIIIVLIVYVRRVNW